MSLPYYKRYPRDFFEGTIGMSFEAKGTYGLVLDLIYKTDGRLKDDSRYIAGMLGCSTRKWNNLRDELVEAGKLVIENGIISNFRADNLLIERRTFQNKQRENRSKANKNKRVKKPRSNQPEPDTDITILEARARDHDDVDQTFSGMVRAKCLDAAGLDDQAIAGSPRLIAPTEIIHLLKPSTGEPCDLELDVLPAIQVCAAQLKAKGQSLKTWSYCREAIIRNRDQRLTPAPVVNLDANRQAKQSRRSASGGGMEAALRAADDEIRAATQPGWAGQEHYPQSAPAHDPVGSGQAVLLDIDGRLVGGR